MDIYINRANILKQKKNIIITNNNKYVTKQLINNFNSLTVLNI